MSDELGYARFRTAIMVCLPPEPAQDALEFLGAMRARQARTIRRLFTAYFLAKAELRALTTDAASRCSADYEMGIEAAAHTCHKDGVRVGRQLERARIVAALNAQADDLAAIFGDDSDVSLIVRGIASAIERGEL